MTTRKDMRRADLTIPYQNPIIKESSGDMSGTLASTLPMAAMFTRNKFIGWYLTLFLSKLQRPAKDQQLKSHRASVVFAIQNWLGESQEQKATSTSPALFPVGMSLMSLVIAYLPLFLPPTLPGTGTRPPIPAAAPPS